MLSRPTPLARPRTAAFTLIELLTVIAIVGILASIIIVAVGQVRSSARQSACRSNLRQIGVGWQLYLSEHKGVFPPFVPYEMYYWGGGSGTWGGPAPETRPLYPYIQDPKIFQCPSDTDDGSRVAFHKLSGNSYVMANSNQRGILSRPVATNRVPIAGVYTLLRNPSRTILVFEQTVRASEASYISNPTATWYRDNWHAKDTSNILMADGHVETFERAALNGYSSPTNPPGYTWGWSHFSGPDW